MWEKFERWVEKWEWLILILASVVVLRIPSLFEPYWYGDEAIYLTIGKALRSGIQLYGQIHDNKPPFLYFLAAIAGGNLFWFKFIHLGWNLVTIWAFANLAAKFFKERKAAVGLAVWAFALETTLPPLEGNIANAENFFLLPCIAAVSWLFSPRPKKWVVAVGGIVIGLGTLFKMPVAVEAGIWPVVWWTERKKQWWLKSGVLVLGVAIPIVLSVWGYYAMGSGKEYLNAAWRQNLPYLSSWKATSAATGLYSTKGRVVVLAIVLAVTAGTARKWGREKTIWLVWGELAIFAALLSGRPYPHYLLQAAPALGLAVGVFLVGERAEKFLAGGMVALAAIVFVVFNFYGYSTSGYYLNFAHWVSGLKTREEYYAWFNPQVNNNYAISQIVKAGTREGDRIFVWGDEPMIYAMTGRMPPGKYTVKYHVKDFQGEEETLKSLYEQKPKFIVSFGQDDELPGLPELLSDNYQLVQSVGTARIFKLPVRALVN